MLQLAAAWLTMLKLSSCSAPVKLNGRVDFTPNSDFVFYFVFSFAHCILFVICILKFHLDFVFSIFVFFIAPVQLNGRVGCTLNSGLSGFSQ